MRSWSLTATGVAVGTTVAIVALLAADEVGAALRGGLDLLTPSVLVAVVAVTVVVTTIWRVWGKPVTLPAAALRARARRVPARLALPILVGGATALQVSLNEAVSMPRVFGDEMIFTDLAKSFAATGELVVRGVTDNGHSILYPVLISPPYAFAGDGVEAFDAVQVMNSAAMALTAVPAYYLARRVVSHGWSLAVATLAVLIPAMAYSSLVMTEPLFYPAFTAAALAIVVTLERPTLARQLVTAALLVGLVAVRTQALALVPAIATAVVVYSARGDSFRRQLAAFWPTWIVLGLIAVAGVAASRIGAVAPTGAYGALLRSYDPLQVGKWAVWNAATFELSLGVVAFGAVPLALGPMLSRRASARERSFGAAAAALLVWVLASVAVLSASPFGLEILHERSLFFLTPLVLTCLAYWLARGVRPRIAVVLAVAAGLVALAAALPERLFLHPSTIDAPTNVLWLALDDRFDSIPTRWFVVGAAVAGAIVLLSARTATLPLLSLVVAFVFVTANEQWRAPLTRAQTERLAWLDDALPDGAHATVVHVAVDSDGCPNGSDNYQGEAVTWTEFFNKSVNRVYGVLGEVENDGLKTPQLTIRPDGELARAGRSIAPDYAVVDSRVRVVGTELASLNLHDFPGVDTRRHGALTLWRPEKPLRLVFPGPLLDGRPELLACPRIGT